MNNPIFVKKRTMRLVIQRVKKASVTINGLKKASIGPGMLILIGIEQLDQEEDVIWLANKVTSLRIFSDEKGAMNLDIQSIGGSIMVVSQFTLHASTKKGNRPGFTKAAHPGKAIPMYELFVDRLRENNLHVETGVFGAMMEVALINDGPVTIWMDSKNRE